MQDLPSIAAPAQDKAQLLMTFSLWAVFRSVVILVATLALIRASRTLLMALANRVPRARFFFAMLVPVLRFFLWLVASLTILYMFAPTRQTLFAILASVGIAFGLGAQDLVKNLVGGLVILADRPYQLGDRVKIGDAYGEIDHIGLRSTKLTTPDDTRVTIPNSEVLSGKAWNSNSGVPDCQVVTDLYLPHGCAPDRTLQVGYEAAYSSPYTLLRKPVVCLLQDGWDKGPYLRLRVKAYVYDHRFEPRLQSDVTQRAKTEFARIGIAFPEPSGSPS